MTSLPGPATGGSRWRSRAAQLAQSPLAITVGVVAAIVVTGLVAVPLGALVVIFAAIRAAGQAVIRALSGARPRGGGRPRPLPQR